MFWSSVAGKSYPIPIRVLSFEAQHKTADPHYQHSRVSTYAAALRERFDREVKELLAKTQGQSVEATADVPDPISIDEPETVDVLSLQINNAIECFVQQKIDVINKIRNRGFPWKGIAVAIEAFLPESMADRSNHAHNAVRSALDRAFGRGAWGTEKRPRKNDASASTTWVVLKLNPMGTGEER